MYTSIYKKYIIKILLLTFLPISLTWASHSQKQDNHFSWENTRVNVGFGLGIPYGFLAKNLLDEKGEKDKTLNTHLNYNLGVGAGYHLPISASRSIGLETGIGYGFARSVEIPALGITFQENYLKIPLLVAILQTYKLPFYFASSLIMGYEFCFMLNSDYKQSGDYKLPASMKGNKDGKELPDFSQLSGNIIVGNRLDFPQGIYLETKVNVPIEFFKLPTSDRAIDQLDKSFVTFMRVLNANWAEISLGCNIMGLVYPQKNRS